MRCVNARGGGACQGQIFMGITAKVAGRPKRPEKFE
jgi:hypothetical protein